MSSGHVGTTRLLTEKKGGLLNVFETCKAISMKNKLGATPLDQALAAKNKDLVKILVDAGENAGSDTLSKASREGNRDAVALLIGAGVAVDSHDREEYKTPLICGRWKSYRNGSLFDWPKSRPRFPRQSWTYTAVSCSHRWRIRIRSGTYTIRRKLAYCRFKSNARGIGRCTKNFVGSRHRCKKCRWKRKHPTSVAIEHNLTGKRRLLSLQFKIATLMHRIINRKRQLSIALS